MAVTMISRYKTDDGEIFDTRALAEQHEAELVFKRNYETDVLVSEISVNSEAIPADQLILWLHKNKDIILPILCSIMSDEDY